MPNPTLNAEQLVQANELLERIRSELAALAADDPDLLFAYRRKVAKMLVYDERSGPNERRRLKRHKATRPRNKAVCAHLAKSRFPSLTIC